MEKKSAPEHFWWIYYTTVMFFRVSFEDIGYAIEKYTLFYKQHVISNTSTAQKMFFTKDVVSKCDQIRSFLQIWSYLLKKSLMENFIFCIVEAQILIAYFFTIWKNNSYIAKPKSQKGRADRKKRFKVIFKGAYIFWNFMLKISNIEAR